MVPKSLEGTDVPPNGCGSPEWVSQETTPVTFTAATPRAARALGITPVYAVLRHLAQLPRRSPLRVLVGAGSSLVRLGSDRAFPCCFSHSGSAEAALAQLTHTQLRRFDPP